MSTCKLCDEGVPLKRYFDGTMKHFDGLMAWSNCEAGTKEVTVEDVSQSLDHLGETALRIKAERDELLRALKELLRLTNTIEVLGEWEAIGINSSLRKKNRAIVDAAIAKARAVITKAEAK